jgi:hypothetical protein
MPGVRKGAVAGGADGLCRGKAVAQRAQRVHVLRCCCAFYFVHRRQRADGIIGSLITSSASSDCALVAAS